MSDDNKTNDAPKKKKPTKPATVSVVVEAAFDGFKRGDKLELPNDQRTAGLLRNNLIAKA